MYFSLIFSLPLVCCYLLYSYFRKKTSLFKKAGVPYIAPWPIVGNVGPLIFKTMSFPELLSKFYYLNPKARYVGLFECATPVIIIRDPELIKLIGTKQFNIFYNRKGLATIQQDPIVGSNLSSLRDEKWRQMRSILNPSFNPHKNQLFFQFISEKSRVVSTYVLNSEIEEINIKSLFQKLTFDVILTYSFGVSTNSLENENDIYMKQFKEMVVEDVEKKKFLLLHCPLIWKLLGMNFLNDKTVKFFKDIVETGISETEKQNTCLANVIHAMMGAQVENKFTMEEIIGQLFIIFLAAFNTTSDSLMYACYELAINTQVQERLQKEIDALRMKCNAEKNANSSGISLADINELKYLDAVIKETMRLHTAIAFLERINSQTFELPPALPGSKSLIVEPETIFMIPTDCLHHDAKYFRNPDKFDPDRFYGANDKIVANSYTYLPFGIGPRHCLANRFALQIIKIVMFQLLSKCNIKTCSKTPISLEKSMSSVITVSEVDIFLRFKERVQESMIF